MFSIDQIQNAYKKVKSGADFPQLIQDLNTLGVTHYDHNVANGQTNYFGTNNFIIKGPVKYPSVEINDIGFTEKLKHALSIHQRGQTDYLTFCKDAAEAGVEKWTTDIIEMTVTYLDKKKNKLTVEKIPKP